MDSILEQISIFAQHPITWAAFLIAIFLRYKGLKKIAYIAIPLLWLGLMSSVFLYLTYQEWSNDLNRKDYLPINYETEIDIANVKADIRFIKLIKIDSDDKLILMAEVDIAPDLVDVVIRVDCINVQFLGARLNRGYTYSKAFLHKGIEPLMPALPEADYPLIWYIHNMDIEDKTAEDISTGITVTVKENDFCHQKNSSF